MIGGSDAGNEDKVPSAAEVLARVRAHARERGDAGSGVVAPTTSHTANVRFEVALDLLNDATGYYSARLREETAEPVLGLPREATLGPEVDAIREQLATIREVQEWLDPADTVAVDAVIAHYGALTSPRICGHRRLEEAREAGGL